MSTPPVVHVHDDASEQSLTDQVINDRLASGAVISNTALAIRQAKAGPGFGSHASYPQARQVARAGKAQLTPAVGESRDARC